MQVKGDSCTGKWNSRRLPAASPISKTLLSRSECTENREPHRPSPGEDALGMPLEKPLRRMGYCRRLRLCACVRACRQRVCLDVTLCGAPTQLRCWGCCSVVRKRGRERRRDSGRWRGRQSWSLQLHSGSSGREGLRRWSFTSWKKTKKQKNDCFHRFWLALSNISDCVCGGGYL